MQEFVTQMLRKFNGGSGKGVVDEIVSKIGCRLSIFHSISKDVNKCLLEDAKTKFFFWKSKRKRNVKILHLNGFDIMTHQMEELKKFNKHDALMNLRIEFVIYCIFPKILY